MSAAVPRFNSSRDRDEDLRGPARETSSSSRRMVRLSARRHSIGDGSAGPLHPQGTHVDTGIRHPPALASSATRQNEPPASSAARQNERHPASPLSDSYEHAESGDYDPQDVHEISQESSHQSAQPKGTRISYCRAFAVSGQCKNGPQCRYEHLQACINYTPDLCQGFRLQELRCLGLAVKIC